ncbi:NAD(P)-dependent dehydrogenase (short-subunit alcohol dehydrogenase family) [Jatrophihabitans sp. GAS493]|uniref:SDR family NAD(P)-dependent oxidoreductase n=1 Tax=Jatrophihabitans sp. GAS493 TaxID=1907575 RepID=UPI000BB7CEBA|nr:SDR family oxidoreductase [Jatrophihabitans sp. GAS493]SOD72238.1 NAD(P)-dependent dehydrogenase (short-subunit alcohol dehydrogenase family) [Jatrophihabitans sp. GAS493]
MNDFDGLTAIVTGGASGIGAATAALLRDRGARVASLDRSYPTAAFDSTAAIFQVPCDVANAGSSAAAVALAAEHLGRLDVLINNAGIGATGDVAANDDDEWLRVLNVNVVGIARITRTALPLLVQSAHASIVNTASVVANVGVGQRALYSASKGAVQSLTLAMAADHVKQGVRVNAVAPGTADTPWVGRLLEQAQDAAAAAAALRARQPMGRLVTADEVAFAIAYLASPLSGSTTGSILAVDGGMSGLRVS